MGLATASGRIVMLRVNNVGDSFGRPPDNIVGEVVVQLDTQTQTSGASGFQLRVDANQPARQGMLDLLRDAFNHGWRAHFDHELADGHTKGTIIRVWVTKDPPPPPASGGVFSGGGVLRDATAATLATARVAEGRVVFGTVAADLERNR